MGTHTSALASIFAFITDCSTKHRSCQQADDQVHDFIVYKEFAHSCIQFFCKNTLEIINLETKKQLSDHENYR